jgi:single-stranded DNA-binding protein
MNNNRDLFTGNLTAEPELNCPLKGTVVVNASLAINELYISENGKRQQITN